MRKGLIDLAVSTVLESDEIVGGCIAMEKRIQRYVDRKMTMVQ